MNEFYQNIVTYKHLPFNLTLFDKNTENDLHHYPKHWHEYLELNLTIKGTGVAWIDGNEYQIKDHNVFIINSNSIHQITGNPPFEDILGFCLQIDLLSFKNLFPNLKTYFHTTCNSAQTKKLIDEVSFLHQLIQKEESTFDIYIQLIKIIKYLDENLSFDLGYQNSNKYKERLLQISKYILAHYNEPLDTYHLADQFKMSQSHLHKLFKDHFGQSIRQYITEIRMMHAIDDLKYTDLSILEISLKNGFPSNKAFTHDFKKRFEMTPNLYRTQLNKRK